MLLSWLSGRARLYPFEVRIIEAVGAGLRRDSQYRLQRQAEAINYIQRLADGREVNLYRMRRGRAVFDDDLRFPAAADEALLATAALSEPAGRVSFGVEVWLAKGRLFSLEFS
ncbi:hypothetical protein [Dyella silvatica]|uniref:hypothetical protein n=1 Tax=Dyella silvatica TaxID=2992128 RepID=UPI00224C8F61|nr:hypothetical protein [Dyella silvatica]